MKNQRWLAPLLAALMLLSVLAGCGVQPANTTGSPASSIPSAGQAATATPEAAATKPVDSYAETVHFTGSAVPYLSDGVDYSADAVYQALSKKFNFTYQLYPLTWDNWAEKNRIWITSGDMPNFSMWNFNYSEYVNYAQQGLIASLPKGWEQKYVNLNDMLAATGIQQKINLDGLTYAIPRATFKNFAPVKRAISHAAMFYRDDIREALGLEPFGDTITLDQIDAYLKGSLDKKLTTIGLSTSPAHMANLFVSMGNSGWNNFYKKDGQYVWGPAQPETLVGIKLFKTYYDKGILDKDFYLNKSTDHRNKFAAGMAAMMMDGGTVNGMSTYIQEYNTSNAGKDGYSIVKMATPLGPDGRWHGAETGNFWASTVFKPQQPEETLNRILALMDYMCTVEGQELAQLGIEGKDWSRNADGSYSILREKNEKGAYPLLRDVYPSCALWYQFGVLVDDFSFVDPTRDSRVIDSVVRMYKAKEEKGDILPYNPDYEFFTSDAKSAYSLDVVSEIVRIVMTEGADIDAEWAKFIETQKPVWQPVVNDLNAALQ